MKGLSKLFSALRGTSPPLPDISLLAFDATEWTSIESGAESCRWTNEDHDELTLSFEPQRPELEFDPRDVETGREYFRYVTGEIGQGFVELNHRVLCGVDASRYIIKIKQNPSGVAYIGNLQIPFNNCHWSVNVLCKELGVTGLRETLVLNEKMASGEVKLDAKNQQMIGWARDPYDANLVPEFGYTLADDSEYDTRFPHHPLSRLRRALESIESTLAIDRSSNCLNAYVP
jgi:hypothetical protein